MVWHDWDAMKDGSEVGNTGLLGLRASSCLCGDGIRRIRSCYMRIVWSHN